MYRNALEKRWMEESTKAQNTAFNHAWCQYDASHFPQGLDECALDPPKAAARRKEIM